MVYKQDSADGLGIYYLRMLPSIRVLSIVRFIMAMKAVHSAGVSGLVNVYLPLINGSIV